MTSLAPHCILILGKKWRRQVAEQKEHRNCKECWVRQGSKERDSSSPTARPSPVTPPRSEGSRCRSRQTLPALRGTLCDCSCPSTNYSNQPYCPLYRPHRRFLSPP